tara:strand:+ start:14645 stop:15664 length:1020 start_codon:yes stop_codon:yes gene_type:complete
LIRIFKYKLSKLYFLVYWLWRSLLNFGIIQQKTFNTKIVSIGNISIGGTGKTPMIETISKELTKNNISHCIVSRGYKKKIKGTVIVSNQQEIISSIEQSGDEPFMLAHSLKNIPIIVGDKSQSIEIAIKKFKPQLILLDDGFQSLKIKRDCDIVLVDLSREFYYYKLLPLGFLREPISSLKRASLIIFTKSNKSIIESEKIKNLVLKNINNSVKVYNSNLEEQIKRYDFEKQCFINDTIDVKNSFVACAGLANNKLFKHMIEEKYTTNNIFYLYPDHHNYNAQDIIDIKESLKQINSKILVTTKKDFYKLYSQFKDYHIYILDIKHDIKDKSEIIDFIK